MRRTCPPLLTTLLLSSLLNTNAIFYVDDAAPSVTYQGAGYANYNANAPHTDLADLKSCYNQTYSGIPPGASVTIPFFGTAISIYGLEIPGKPSLGRNISFTLNTPSTTPTSSSAPGSNLHSFILLLPPSLNFVTLLNNSIYTRNGLPNARYSLTMAVLPYAGNDQSTASFYFDYAEVVGAEEEENVLFKKSVYVASGAITGTSTVTSSASSATTTPTSGAATAGVRTTRVGGVLNTLAGQATGSAVAAGGGSLSTKNSTSQGTIVGATLGALALLLVLIFGVLLLWRRNQRQRNDINPDRDYGDGKLSGAAFATPPIMSGMPSMNGAGHTKTKTKTNTNTITNTNAKARTNANANANTHPNTNTHTHIHTHTHTYTRNTNTNTNTNINTNTNTNINAYANTNTPTHIHTHTSTNTNAGSAAVADGGATIDESPPSVAQRERSPDHVAGGAMSGDNASVMGDMRAGGGAPRNRTPVAGNSNTGMSSSSPRYSGKGSQRTVAPQANRGRSQDNGASSSSHNKQASNSGIALQNPSGQVNGASSSSNNKQASTSGIAGQNLSEKNSVHKSFLALKNGNLETKKRELTVLIVGETGVGKTTLLSLMTNILEGRGPTNYRVTHDLANEADWSKQGSQTKSACLYEFSSLNGVKIRLLDTPGLADTRGGAFDEQHMASIAQSIQDAVPAVDGVLIVANGTTKRLQVAANYVLTTLSSLFPHSITSNIGIVFTMISNPMAFNFQMESLPDGLQEIETFNMNNPIALRNKYEKIRSKPKYTKQAGSMNKVVEDAHDGAVEMLVELFDWLDKREIQPTTAVADLYQIACDIDLRIMKVLTRMNHMAQKKTELEQLKVSTSQSGQYIKVSENINSIMSRTVKVQNDTTHHNTICDHPNCYSNCHIHCSVEFSLDPVILRNCSAFKGDRRNCRRCQHPVTDHRHSHSIWAEEIQQHAVIDEDASRHVTAASDEKLKHEDAMSNVQRTIGALDDETLDAVAKVGQLCQMYAELSLSGHFADQISKTIHLIELNVEGLKANGADTNTIQAILESLHIMREKERYVRNAEETMKRRVQVVSSRPAEGLRPVQK